MIIILQTSFIVEWHKSSVHQKKGVNSLLEYLINISCKIFWSATLWRMTPKNYELGGVYSTNNIQVPCFSQKEKMAHKQRIVKWIDKSKCQSPSTFLHPILVSQSLRGSKQKFHGFISYMFSIFSPGRIWNWREIINEWARKRAHMKCSIDNRGLCGFRV